MSRVVMGILVLAVLAVLGFGAQHYFVSQESAANAETLKFTPIQRLDQDVRMTAVLDTLRAAGKTGHIAIVNVNLVDPIAGTMIPNQTVVVQGEKIEWVGTANAAPGLRGATQIDGTGKFLSPGITDMHVHTEHMAQHILRLAAGVTSARDMDGFPWILRTRDAINSGKMIGATMYVAGTIISDHPLFGYAVQVHTPEEARQTVRNQAACGYSFIKVHNKLAESLFDAVADEAGKLHLDLVGHVPHHMSIFHAVQFGHMRTLEHLKGFLNDGDLTVSDEPYEPALKGAETWITPTLYTRTGDAYGEGARRLMEDPRQNYNPRARREQWAAQIPAPGSHIAVLYNNFVKSQAIIVPRLMGLHARWLVGTDAAGYPFNIAGFAALDELVLLHQLGMPNVDVVRAATSEPAIAMRRPDEFGRIVHGQRADLVLLGANPLEDVAAYQSNLGVMARGRWYDRASLDAALASVALIDDEPVQLTFDLRTADTLVDALKAKQEAGYVFEDGAMTEAAERFEQNGAPDVGKRLRTLLSMPISGVCASEPR